MECFVCHEMVAVPSNADRDVRWVHTHCVGNTPTVPELVMGLLAALPGERFCVDCVTRLIGLCSRKEVDAAIALLSTEIRVSSGRCARCPAKTQVVGIPSTESA